MAKSRWHIENEGFNDAKNRYGLGHIRHHHERSLLIVWLLTCLALTLERLYRLRYLNRGSHPVRAAIRSEEHTSELQSRLHLVCRLLLEKKKTCDAVVSQLDSDETDMIM